MHPRTIATQAAESYSYIACGASFVCSDADIAFVVEVRSPDAENATQHGSATPVSVPSSVIPSHLTSDCHA